MSKSDSANFDATAPLSEQAAHWWVVLNGEDCTQSDCREFATWVSQGPDRVEAYLQTVTAMSTLRSSRVQWPTTPVETLVREARAVRKVETLPTRGVLAEKPRLLGRLMPWAAGIAAMLLLAMSPFLLTEPTQRFRTDVGEQLSVRLGDGSLMTLNTDSNVEVSFDPKHRAVRLISGEALFQVAHEPARPFDVTAGRANIRAVGTEFNVNRRHANTTVTVLEGRVIVSAREIGGGNAATSATVPGGTTSAALEARDRLVMEDSGPVSIGRIGDIEAVKAWTARRLVFENHPLGEIAEEFNRFNRKKIRIADETLRQQEVTGMFKADDPQSFLAFVADIPGVTVHEADGVSTVTVKK